MRRSKKLNWQLQASRGVLPFAALVFVLAMAAAPVPAAGSELQASYPLISDLADATGTYGDTVLDGDLTPPTPPSPGIPLCQNGIYLFSTGGQDIRTPEITSLDTNDFQVSVDFNLTALPTLPGGFPVVMGSRSYRWIGLYIDANGTVGAKYNNSNLTWSTTQISTGVWYQGQLNFEAGELQILLDGILIHQVTIGALNTGDKHNFTTNDFSIGRALNGCIRNLNIDNDTTLVSPCGDDSEPIAHWSFDEDSDQDGASGSVVLDSTANGNDGHLWNGASRVPSPFGITAALLDGVNDYVNVGSKSILDNLQAFTYSAWVYPTAFGDREIFSKRNSTKELRFKGAGTLRGCVIASGGNACSDSVGTVPLNTWTHVAMSYDHSGDKLVHLYIDGAEVGYAAQSTGGGGSMRNDAPWKQILGRRQNNSRPFAGMLDEMMIFDHALPVCRIAQLASQSCFEFTNTPGIDLTDNDWFNDCVDATGDTVTVRLKDNSGVVVYEASGTKVGTWTYDQLTSTASPGVQYSVGNHDRLITLDNGDLLMISGRNSEQAGCGGSLGNGYGLVIYHAIPSIYFEDIYLAVFPYNMFVGSWGGIPRFFGSWGAANEIAYIDGLMSSCSPIVGGGPPLTGFDGSFEVSVSP